MEEKKYRNPSLAVDIIIRCINSKQEDGLVLIERKNPPHGYALPGGFVDYGEATYDAAVREAKEETGLNVFLTRQMFTYSHPHRDPRQHVVSVAYICSAVGDPVADDDAKAIVWVKTEEVADWIEENKDNLVCDHYYVIKDYLRTLEGKFIFDPEMEIKR